MQDGASDENDEGEEQGGGLNLDAVRSYAAFGGRAIKKRRILVGLIVLVGVVLAVTVARFIPRTYVCATTLMTVQNAVLDSERGNRPLAGAEGLLLSHENLERLIQDTNLKKTFAARRPPLLKFKDKLFAALLGPMDDRMLGASLVGTLETRITVTVKDDTLTIEAAWTDSKTATELAAAMQQGFLRLRHKSEISAFHEKMAILNEHASQLRTEIEMLAEQINADLKVKAKARAADKKSTTKPTEAAPSLRVVETREDAVDDQLPGLIERLNGLKQKLASADNERAARIRDEQAKLDELKVRLTPEHPQVIAQQARVGIVSQVPSELSVMRSEATDLESQIRQRQAMVKTGKITVRQVSGAAANDPAAADALSTELLGLMRDKDADPALSAQMSGAVVRYASLRDDVRGAKLALDTAQAAFNHRYQVVIPVDEPTKPTKPKIPVIVAAGVALSLIIGLITPILLELRRDLVVERWQVYHLQLPVLAELRLPERRGD